MRGFYKNWAVWRNFTRQNTVGSVSCRTIPYKMKRSNSRRIGNLLSRAGICGVLQGIARSEEHTSELQSRVDLVCRLLLETKLGKAASVGEVPNSIGLPPQPVFAAP